MANSSIIRKAKNKIVKEFIKDPDIIAAINSSEVMVTQKIGRILRHKNPVIIIPYYIHTREEELVDKILETVSDDNVIVLKDFKKDGIQD